MHAQRNRAVLAVERASIFRVISALRGHSEFQSFGFRRRRPSSAIASFLSARHVNRVSFRPTPGKQATFRTELCLGSCNMGCGDRMRCGDPMGSGAPVGSRQPPFVMTIPTATAIPWVAAVPRVSSGFPRGARSSVRAETRGTHVHRLALRSDGCKPLRVHRPCSGGALQRDGSAHDPGYDACFSPERRGIAPVAPRNPAMIITARRRWFALARVALQVLCVLGRVCFVAPRRPMSSPCILWGLVDLDRAPHADAFDRGSGERACG